MVVLWPARHRPPPARADGDATELAASHGDGTAAASATSVGLPTHRRPCSYPTEPPATAAAAAAAGRQFTAAAAPVWVPGPSLAMSAIPSTAESCSDQWSLSDGEGGGDNGHGSCGSGAADAGRGGERVMHVGVLPARQTSYVTMGGGGHGDGSGDDGGGLASPAASPRARNAATDLHIRLTRSATADAAAVARTPTATGEAAAVPPGDTDDAAAGARNGGGASRDGSSDAPAAPQVNDDAGSGTAAAASSGRATPQRTASNARAP